MTVTVTTSDPSVFEELLVSVGFNEWIGSLDATHIDMLSCACWATHNNLGNKLSAPSRTSIWRFEAVATDNQIISFCSVGVYCQKGIIKYYIQDVTWSGRTLLLHEKNHWPEVIGTILCPFTLKAAKDHRNHLKFGANCYYWYSIMASMGMSGIYSWQEDSERLYSQMGAQCTSWCLSRPLTLACWLGDSCI